MDAEFKEKWKLQTGLRSTSDRLDRLAPVQ